ncbi:MAG: DNA mismatch repair protein MutS [Chloroflexota bacterium]|nr:DNA mismatch repair protein MutS [Chloroflexota bacterium]
MLRVTTPVRRQYLNIKSNYPDCILLFRMGDFFETFDEDAELVARELDIALTSREFGKGQRHPLAGVPYHALNNYLGRLIRKGYKVAICEQTSDPSDSKGLVDREVVRVVTPGTLVEPSLLEEGVNNYLSSVVIDGPMAGFAYIDVSTSNVASVTQLPLKNLTSELDRVAPVEVIVSKTQQHLLPVPYRTVAASTEVVRLESSRQNLLNHLGVASLEGYGCDHLPLAIQAAAALMAYLEDNQKESFNRFSGLSTYDLGSTMDIDPQTRRNLELFTGGRRDSKDHSLLSVLDFTKTAPGARLLREWLSQPLLDIAQIEQRLDTVDWFHSNTRQRESVSKLLSRISDMERLVNRAKSHIAIPREIAALRTSLEALPNLRALFDNEKNSSCLSWLLARLPLCQEACSLLQSAIEDQPGQIGDGSVIRIGFSPEMDELRSASRDARSYIARLENKERERTNIRNLKVGYNKVFGYYIEVTNANLSHIPDNYQRRQTLTNGERFITPELKEYENLVLNARERMEELEIRLYRQICGQIGGEAESILTAAATIAHVDIFVSLAEAAARYNYVRPQVNDSTNIEIVDGRHPMVEHMLPSGAFVPNDAHLSTDNNQLIILTGPNMAGKSTYLRQVALIVLMVQIGSYVPAKSASVGVVDRIFTRVGLQDDLATGQSTFMVEMLETASILNNATKRSLIILDEIGRGTSTYDGLAIAQAVAEHIHDMPTGGCRTLFATHYHELTELAENLVRAQNYSVAVAEVEGNVAFLHRIVAGGANRSYGIHVAQLAGLPKEVIQRAWQVLTELEDTQPNIRLGKASGRAEVFQIGLFPQKSPTLQDLMELDVTAMTPLEAINTLYALQQKAKDDES